MITGVCHGTLDSIHKISSPDGKLVITFNLASDKPVYSVSYDNSIVIAPSLLGIDFREGGIFQSELEIISSVTSSFDETWPVIVGKSSSARNNYNELKISLREKQMPNRDLGIVFRAFDDGAAFRYVFPEQKALNIFAIKKELTEFTLTFNCWYYGAPASKDGEPFYEKGIFTHLPVNSKLTLPITFERNDGIYLAITEANLTDYSGMHPYRNDHSLKLSTSLTPRLDDSTVCVIAKTPHVSPWRVILVGNSPGTLIESNIILNLNEPCKLDDVSWISGYKMMSPWINNYLNTEDDKKWVKLTAAHLKKNTILNIDFAAEHNVGAVEMIGWVGNEQESIDHPDKFDMTKPMDSLDMPYLFDYAKKKGVKLVLWAYWSSIYEQMDKCFPVWEKWGVVSINPDFLDREDQQMVNIYREMAEKAAKYHLQIYYHGASKPTGIRRTYPNIITHEAVRGGEYNKWESKGPEPGYNLLLPYTRMLAGPMDYTPASFSNVTLDKYRGNWNAPSTLGTRAQQLAMLVVYENPQMMLFDWPGAYLNQPGVEFLKTVPTTWDETHFVDGKIGEYIILARRKGNEWYIGGMTDWTSREVSFPLNFIKEGQFTAEIYADGITANENPKEMIISTSKVSTNDKMTINMAQGGGFAIHLNPFNK